MNCSFVRVVMKNIGFDFLLDDLSNIDSKGLNYQDYEVSVRNKFTRRCTGLQRGAATRRLHLMRRNVYDYEDVRNVHKYETVPNNTDELFETLYEHEILYHDTTTPRNAIPVQSTNLWADDSQTRQRGISWCGRDLNNEPDRTSRAIAPKIPWILGVNHWFRLGQQREGLINLREVPTTGLDGQPSELSLQHELLKKGMKIAERRMNQQFVR